MHQILTKTPFDFTPFVHKDPKSGLDQPFSLAYPVAVGDDRWTCASNGEVLLAVSPKLAPLAEGHAQLLTERGMSAVLKMMPTPQHHSPRSVRRWIQMGRDQWMQHVNSCPCFGGDGKHCGVRWAHPFALAVQGASGTKPVLLDVHHLLPMLPLLEHGTSVRVASREPNDPVHFSNGCYPEEPLWHYVVAPLSPEQFHVTNPDLVL